MSRNVFKQALSPCEYRFRDVLQTTSGGISYHYDLKRAEVQKGEWTVDWLHPTDYWASRISEIGMIGEWRYNRYGGLNHYKGCLNAVSTGSYVPVGYSLIPFESKYLARAVIDAREQLLGDNALNFLQNLAERQQAIDLVTDRLTSIRRGYQFARKRKWKQAFKAIGLHKQKIARRLSENILAWNYGVAPLADDVVNAIKQSSNPPPEKYLKVEGTAGNGAGVNKRVEDNTGGALPRLIDYNERHLAKCVMWVHPKNHLEIKNAALMMNNPFLLGYELTPYSFLLDWVWDVGGWLTAIGATDGWEFFSGYTMERTVCTSTYSSLSTTTNGFSTIQSGNMRECKQFRRKRLMSFPVPGNPGFKNPFSLIHALNAVALFGART